MVGYIFEDFVDVHISNVGAYIILNGWLQLIADPFETQYKYLGFHFQVKFIEFLSDINFGYQISLFLYFSDSTIKS